MLVTGFPYDVHRTLDDVIGLFAAYVGEARAVRRLGSAAIDLCWVAAGRMDGFWEERLQPWDTRAGALLVQEAGGRVSGLGGEPWDAAAGHLDRLERAAPRRPAECGAPLPRASPKPDGLTSASGRAPARSRGFSPHSGPTPAGIPHA